MINTTSTPAMREAVRAQIIQTNPDIVAIKEGCRVLWSGDEKTICGVQTTGIHFGKVQLVYRGQTVGDWVREDEDDTEEGWSDAAYFDKPWQTVIGRQIRLADVANAIHESGRFMLRDVATEEMRARVGFPEWEECSISDLLLGCWNWQDDDLDHQSDDTISFLHSVLCS